METKFICRKHAICRENPEILFRVITTLDNSNFLIVIKLIIKRKGVTKVQYTRVCIKRDNFYNRNFTYVSQFPHGNEEDVSISSALYKLIYVVQSQYTCTILFIIYNYILFHIIIYIYIYMYIFT